MFEYLRKYNKILVTGPQRSGTRIAAKAIALDTGYTYIDEKEFKVSNLNQLREILKKDKIVIQCPGVSAWIQKFSSEDTLIIFMKRDTEDILASQKRINWQQKTEVSKYNRSGGIICLIKYDEWERQQRPIIKHWLELEYESLAKHPLWIPKEKRLNFKARQTKL